MQLVRVKIVRNRLETFIFKKQNGERRARVPISLIGYRSGNPVRCDALKTPTPLGAGNGPRGPVSAPNGGGVV